MEWNQEIKVLSFELISAVQGEGLVAAITCTTTFRENLLK